MPPLKGHVTLVTGASRGAGRGIAEALGAAGATVYLTGRSADANSRTEGLPGTVEETARAVAARGGTSVPIPCDHTDDEQVWEVFRRIEEEAGHLDLLVNNVWGGYERYGESGFVDPFWQQPLWRWDAMFTSGVRAHYTASRFGFPLLERAERGLIVSTVAWDDDKFLGAVGYDTAKHATVRLIQGMARELRPWGISAIAVAPGFMRTERVLAEHEKSPLDLGSTESPEYVGRAIVALASDPAIMERSGGVFRVGDLADAYGFTDVDGRRVPPFTIPESS